MSDTQMIPASEAKELLDAANLHGCDLDHVTSYDPDGRYPTGARSLVYINGFEDVDGLGNFQKTGGPICDGVPEEVAPLFAAAPDLAHTVIEQAEQIQRVRNVLNGIAREKAESEHARDHGHDNTEWHETNTDTLEYIIDLFTEALEGDT